MEDDLTTAYMAGKASRDPEVRKLTAEIADTKAAWERDVRLNAELRAKQDADLAAARAEAGAYREALEIVVTKDKLSRYEVIDENLRACGDLAANTLARFATPAAEPQVGKEAP